MFTGYSSTALSCEVSWFHMLARIRSQYLIVSSWYAWGVLPILAYSPETASAVLCVMVTAYEPDG